MKTNISEIELRIEGMNCASCVSHVEKSLKSVKGVEKATVNLVTERAVVFVQNGTSHKDIISAVDKAGYKGIILTNGISKKLHTTLDIKKNELFRLIISAIISSPFIISMFLMFFSIHWEINVWVQLLLATIVQFYIGKHFYISAWKSIKSKSPNMDLLITIGTSSAYALSLYQILVYSLKNNSGSLHLYFESSTLVITLVILGKWLESSAKKQTMFAIKSLQLLRPENARILLNDKEVEIEISNIKLKDIAIIRPGERIPVDGKIIHGITEVDESLITGESLPIDKSTGDKVTAGSLNGNGFIKVITEAIGEDTFISKIIRLVENAQVSKTPIQKLVDRVSAIFIPIVLIIGVFTFILCGVITGNWDLAVFRTASIFIIACPCALGLATPITILVGTGVAAKNGILIKDAEAFEMVHSIKVIAFDKTGTLTEGKPKLTSFLSEQGSDNSVLKIAAGLQYGSEHPLAKAVVLKAYENGIQIPDAQNMQAILGKGVTANIDGLQYYLGSEKLIHEFNVKINDELLSKAKKFATEGQSISWLFIKTPESTTIKGLLSFSDSIKKNAIETIHHLNLLGIKTVMLTGDNTGSANAVATVLNINEVYSNLLPADKTQCISNLKMNNRDLVAMVGDGINDAPALASADIGISMASGTDVAIHASGITLMRNDPMVIINAIEISKNTYHKIRQNLFWAFVYNVIGIPLAALGYLNPVLSAFIMACSSISVIGNALLLRRWKPLKY